MAHRLPGLGSEIGYLFVDAASGQCIIELRMATEPTNAEKLRGLPWSIGADFANTIFCQLTVFGSAFVLFLNELGLGKTHIGFLLSLFPFCGVVALFIAPTVERVGRKRVFLTFWGIRKFVAASLLLTPLVVRQFGPEAAHLFVTCVVLTFAMCRAIGETAYYPWFQEFVPDAVRGKYSAIDNIVVTLGACAAVAVASHVIGHSTGLGRFMWLIGGGFFFGLLCVWCSSFIPGGAPVEADKTTRFEELKEALRDRNYRLYLAGLALVTLGSTPLAAFLPLFLRDQVGLTEGNVVLLSAGTLLGGLLSSYLWGWAADRYGSKPVLLSSLYATMFLPACWLLIPRGGPWSNHIAMGIAVFGGLAGIGAAVSMYRFLFVGVVPAERKTEYMAIYYAWVGLVGGVGPLIAGRALDYSKALSGKLYGLTIDPYTPIFVASVLLTAGGILFYRLVRADSTMTAFRFAGMFLEGNPFIAFESMIRYHLAKDEEDRISVTERLGEAESPLNVDELIEALSDPSFHVRHEAIISIARTRPDERLTRALIGVLDGPEPELSLLAAWALGRIGDRRAIEPLRKALATGSPMLRAQCARSLGRLGDDDSIPLLLERLRSETDIGLRVAYASALGSLGVTAAREDLRALLHSAQAPTARMELAFNLARLVGEPHNFIRLWRQARADAATPASQEMISLREWIEETCTESAAASKTADETAQTLGRGDLAAGAVQLAHLIRLLPLERLDGTCRAVLSDCADFLGGPGSPRIEYLLLALHTMGVVSRGLTPQSRDS